MRCTSNTGASAVINTLDEYGQRGAANSGGFNAPGGMVAGAGYVPLQGLHLLPNQNSVEPQLAAAPFNLHEHIHTLANIMAQIIAAELRSGLQRQQGQLFDRALRGRGVAGGHRSRMPSVDRRRKMKDFTPRSLPRMMRPTDDLNRVPML
jgi:hypothetical protein